MLILKYATSLLLAVALAPSTQPAEAVIGCDLEAKLSPFLEMRCEPNDCQALCPIRISIDPSDGGRVYYCELCPGSEEPDCMTRLHYLGGLAIVLCANHDCDGECKVTTLADDFKTCTCE